MPTDRRGSVLVRSASREIMVNRDRTTIGTIIPVPGNPLPGIVADIWTLVVGWCRRARSRHALAKLSDRLLRDINISREQRNAECEKAFWQD